MKNNDVKPTFLEIQNLGFDTKMNWNLNPDKLEDICLSQGIAKKTNLDAIAIDTGVFTGRSPKDRFIVKDALTKDNVFWGDINQPFSESNFNNLKTKLISHLNKKEIYIRNCFACAEQKNRINITLITEIAWSDLFGHNMFIRPSLEELKSFKHEWTVICSPSFKATSEDGTRKENFSIINLSKKEIIIGGTGYTGEIKKGIFSALNFILPFEKNILPMHCSANIGIKNDTALFFGLSGTGKTTLSANKERKLIGDDEHGWSENSIFNFEGGCYAKCIDLSFEKEPDIYLAIKKGALLENVGLKNNNEIDFTDDRKTQNTRVSYPIHHIKNIIKPSIGKTPKNIFFLTADAFGVLPPISKLNSEQVMFHFVSGYTAKVAGTEEGIIEPEATFSACFGAPFMPLHPMKYAKMLVEKIEKYNVNVWLINTGWTGGPYGIGKRISLNYTRSMVNAALNGDLNNVEYKKHNIFNLSIPRECPSVPAEILEPSKTWKNKDDYISKANKLATLFKENFSNFSTKEITKKSLG